MLTESQVPTVTLTLLHSFVLSDYSINLRDCKLKTVTVAQVHNFVKTLNRSALFKGVCFYTIILTAKFWLVIWAYNGVYNSLK